jgi:hypothetical protein
VAGIDFAFGYSIQKAMKCQSSRRALGINTSNQDSSWNSKTSPADDGWQWVPGGDRQTTAPAPLCHS